MVDHTKDVVANIILEPGGYASGSTGGTPAYNEHPFADDEGDPMQAPFVNVTMPLQTKDREIIKPIGNTMGKNVLWDKGIFNLPTSPEQYVQNDRWPDAIVNGMASATIPSMSYAVHWETAQHKEDAFGIFPVEWLLNLEKGERERNVWPKQTTKLNYFS